MRETLHSGQQDKEAGISAECKHHKQRRTIGCKEGGAVRGDNLGAVAGQGVAVGAKDGVACRIHQPVACMQNSHLVRYCTI